MNTLHHRFCLIAFLLYNCFYSSFLLAQNTWVEWDDESTTWLSDVTNNSHEKDIAISDLNKDGWTDIVVVQKAPFSNQGPRQDLLLMNNGGALTDQTAAYAPGFLSNPSDARDVFIGDFDNDGWDDVVIANTFGDQPIFYHNRGDDVNGNWLGLVDESTSRFPLPLNIPLLQFCAVWAGDIDGNGALDLYFSNYGLNGLVLDVLLMNNGNGYFTDESATRLGDLRNSAFGTSVEITDMDGDDDLDIVKISTLFGVQPWNANAVLLLFNDGTGNFTNWQNLTPGAAPYMFTIGDFNENGLNDLYVVDDNSDYILLVNSAIPDFSISFSTQISPDPRTVYFGGNCKLADLDKDGDLDIGIAGADVDIPPCEISGLRQFTMNKNDNGFFSAPYGPVNYPWNVSAYDFAFLDLDNDCFPDLFLGLCDGFQVFINQSENETIEISGDTLICGSESTTLMSPGGYAGYSWSNGSNNQNITVNQENTYCVTITKSNGCTIEDCVNVIELLELNTEISGNTVLCTLETTTLFSEPGFSTYAWTTNQTTPNILVNQGGIYCVTVTDENGCTGSDCVTVVEQVEVIVNISGESNICAGESTTLFATSGFSEYLWSTNETNQDIIVGNEGTYCVQVTDQFGCIGDTCFSVIENPPVIVNITGESFICHGNSTELAADGGFITYNWSNGESTPTINVNNGGNYCVEVTDEFGCTENTCFTVVESLPIDAGITGDLTICTGESSELFATAGFASYSWSNGETDSTIEVNTDGMYCVTITDANDCTAETCATVLSVSTSSSEISELICFGETLKIAGESFSESGDYEIVLPNANAAGCDSTILLNLTVDPEIVLINSIITIDDGSNSGAIEIEFEGGTPPYMAEWSNGASGLMISNLIHGDYWITIVDVYGCTTTFTFTVDLETLVQSQLLEKFAVEIKPNPFSTTTQLTYQLPTTSNMKIEVVNSKGRTVENLFEGQQLPGSFTFDWPAENQASGIYYFKIQVDGVVLIKKVILVK